MFAPPPREFIYTAYKLDVIFADDLGQEKSCYGTGFLLAAEETVVLVTNRHVVDLDYDAPDRRYTRFAIKLLRLHGRGGDDKRYELELDHRQPFAFPDARENDLACLVNFRGNNPDPNFKLFHHMRVSDLATAQDFRDSIWAGDRVYFAGYPSVHDKLDQRPILRAGVVASDPKFDYSISGSHEGNKVAYEAMSTPGASGSPVFAPARGFAGAPYARGDLLAGINAGHIHGDQGAHSGMSYFIKATAIRALLAKQGVAGA